MTLREQKRWETSHRITLCAQRLTDEHGHDGFTMDDLADAAEVSRRTLFNYFPSKTDAVLGAPPEIPDAVVDTFRAGGPHGHLIDDLTELVRAAMGADFGAARARLLLRLLLALLDVALDSFIDGDDHSLVALFEAQVHEARSLLT